MTEAKGRVPEGQSRIKWHGGMRVEKSLMDLAFGT